MKKYQKVTEILPKNTKITNNYKDISKCLKKLQLMLKLKYAYFPPIKKVTKKLWKNKKMYQKVTEILRKRHKKLLTITKVI
jgi:hypothetical protein